jgi:glycerophosphoryl diester phosphodiesterase
VDHPFFALERPIVIGHRGCAGEAPENTLASFERALACGAAVLESDVHLTRDGVPVLIHDEVVDRCTEASGAVADFDLAGLQKLDAGYRFSSDGGRSHPARGAGHRIPTLLEALQTFPGARFNLELKQSVPGMVEQTLAAVRAAGRAESCLLTSAQDALMGELRARVASEALPVALGACTGEVAAVVRAAVAREPAPSGLMALQIPSEFAGRPLVTRELVDCAHAHDIQVHVWTINDPGEMSALLALGVDGIVTDFPGRLARLLAAGS